ncbi:MAG: sigma-54-dependent Fis family transcriptional regulator [Bacteroidetes bacterium]|nr:MAG: sigma-54-dependent Fis family transcriptional regulator [Bacteroidota bacterium]
MLLKKSRILIVDDDPDVLVAVKLLLKTEAQEVVTERNPENIRAQFTRNRFDLVLLDMNYRSSLNTGNEGLYWLRQVLGWDPEATVVMITAFGDIDLAVRCLKEGAADFIIKPWRNDRLIESLEEALEKKSGGKNTRTRRSAASGDSGLGMIGNSDEMLTVFHKIEKIAPTDANVLILGENGSGKELVAKAIHQKSLRAARPFVQVDVGALTESLFESELFGYKKGAFTGASEDRPGRFETAQGGTLFLDEIGNISLPQQARLLSVLQNREVFRVGDSRPIPIDIRLICATNAPLYELASEARFRKDLIYRINTVEITLPPLRVRGEDVTLLARHFISLYAEKYHKPAPEPDAAALEKLRKYPFPGNVRELQHTMERAVIMCENDTLHAADLIFSPIEKVPAASESPDTLRLDDVEKHTILKVIEKHRGNISRAAKELGITRTALYRRLGKYEI